MSEPAKTPLTQWFEDLVRTRYRTMRDLAKVARREAGSLTRSAAQTGSAGLEPLLRLAADIGESPTKVLEIARKSDMDTLIRQLYGRPSATYPSEVQAVVDLLMADDPRLGPIQQWMKDAARDWRGLLPSRTPTDEPATETAPAKSGRPSRTGTRSK